MPIRHHFLQLVNVSPYQKEYHVGDTIRFGFTDTGKLVLDTITGTFIKADSLQYTIRASLERLDNYKQPTPALGYFFTSSDGYTFSQNTDGNNYGGVSLDANISACSGGPDLLYLAGVIPRQPGIYILDFFLPYDGTTNCHNGSGGDADITFRFNLPDCNADLMNGLGPSMVDPQDLSAYTNSISAKISFAFKVD